MLELCVIFGGQSPEHEISRKSVTSVLNNLNKDKYNIFFTLILVLGILAFLL